MNFFRGLARWLGAYALAAFAGYTIAAAGITFHNLVRLAALGIEAGDWVRLNVVDTGIGIDESVIPHIFEPFFTTKGDSGTGLGLATVHGAVSQAGGHARVESVPGKGTTFSIYLPRIATATSTPADTPAIPALPRANPGETILLIEDVVTSGGQVAESALALRQLGATVGNALCVIDREAGGRDGLAAAGIRLHSLFRMSELKNTVADDAFGHLDGKR